MKIRCKKCGEIIEGDKKGTYITCKCKAIAIDETTYYWRINGNLEDYEEVKENEIEKIRMNGSHFFSESIETWINKENSSAYCEFLSNKINELVDEINKLKKEK